jgi:hypothetical protein
MFREWVCLDHTGLAGHKAQQWWKTRFGGRERVTMSDALGNMLFPQQLIEWTKTITVKKNGKFFEIVGYNKPLHEAT